MRTRRLACGFVLAAVFALAASGCTTVRAWERGTLAHHSMNPAANERVCPSVFIRHLLETREGSTGGGGGAGGGCGCN